uniref:Alkaline ceramidase n=1 Tax=Panagrolaimus davidi TaxID=227884 RepID=A0A914PVS2_9BILA
MAPWFEYESGHAWCESAYKYQTLTFVAEFANSATNLPIIILPLVNIAILWRYIREVNWMIIHATLNLFGQLVDELSLVWLINMCLVVYMPVMKWYPQQYKDHMDRIRWSIVGFTTLLSGLCFIKPNLNALALMTYIFVIYYEGSKYVFFYV